MDEPGKAEEGLGLLCRMKSAPANFSIVLEPFIVLSTGLLRWTGI